SGSYFYQLSVTAIPLLGLSRFPIADYRSLMGVFLLYFSGLALVSFLEYQYSRGEFYFRVLSLIITLCLGWYILYFKNINHRDAIEFIIASILFILFLFLNYSVKLNKFILYLLIIILILFDGVRIWSGNRSAWISPHITSRYYSYYS